MDLVTEPNGLSAFFSALAERAYKENDLSDMTYALLEANKTFRQFFLDFFFPNEGLVGNQVVIEREHAVGEGRPDFWIRTGGEVYLVEVKIWDGGHHFEQYHEILKKEGSRNGPAFGSDPSDTVRVIQSPLPNGLPAQGR